MDSEVTDYRMVLGAMADQLVNLARHLNYHGALDPGTIYDIETLASDLEFIDENNDEEWDRVWNTLRDNMRDWWC